VLEPQDHRGHHGSGPSAHAPRRALRGGRGHSSASVRGRRPLRGQVVAHNVAGLREVLDNAFADRGRLAEACNRRVMVRLGMERARCEAIASMASGESSPRRSRSSDRQTSGSRRMRPPSRRSLPHLNSAPPVRTKNDGDQPRYTLFVRRRLSDTSASQASFSRRKGPEVEEAQVDRLLDLPCLVAVRNTQEMWSLRGSRVRPARRKGFLDAGDRHRGCPWVGAAAHVP